MNKLEMKVDGESAYTAESKIAIIDSGTSFNLMPTKDVRVMMANFKKNLGISCSLDIVPICDCPG